MGHLYRSYIESRRSSSLGFGPLQVRGPFVVLEEGDLESRAKLAKSLRKSGVLKKGGTVKRVELEGDTVRVMPELRGEDNADLWYITLVPKSTEGMLPRGPNIFPTLPPGTKRG